MFRYFEPEVAGGLGAQTILHRDVFPPSVEKLHYEFEGWLGDDILESFPCFIVTDSLKKSIEHEKLSGIVFDNVFITKSQEFEEMYPGKILPQFHWAKITGGMGVDDFAINADARLAISGRAFEILSSFRIAHASIEEIKA